MVGRDTHLFTGPHAHFMPLMLLFYWSCSCVTHSSLAHELADESFSQHEEKRFHLRACLCVCARVCMRVSCCCWHHRARTKNKLPTLSFYLSYTTKSTIQSWKAQGLWLKKGLKTLLEGGSATPSFLRNRKEQEFGSTLQTKKICGRDWYELL